MILTARSVESKADGKSQSKKSKKIKQEESEDADTGLTEGGDNVFK